MLDELSALYLSMYLSPEEAYSLRKILHRNNLSLD